jgi:hypothetical protein
MAEMFAMALLNNHYFVLLYKFKEANPDVKLVSEYDKTERGQDSSGDESGEQPQQDREGNAPPLFCGVLDEIKVLMPMQNEASSSTISATQATQIHRATRNGLQLLLDVEEMAIASKEARDHDQAIQKEIQGQIQCDLVLLQGEGAIPTCQC